MWLHRLLFEYDSALAKEQHRLCHEGIIMGINFDGRFTAVHVLVDCKYASDPQSLLTCWKVFITGSSLRTVVIVAWSLGTAKNVGWM